MTDTVGAVSADAATTARRRTWIPGGILFVLASGAPFLGRVGVDGAWQVRNWLFLAGVLLFVVGFGRAGSITARRPVSSIAAVLLALAFLVQPYLYDQLPTGTGNLYEEEDAWIALGIGFYGVLLVLALTATIGIARAAAVPPPWNWAPLWALIGMIVVGAAVIGYGPFLAPLVTTLFLGAVAIVLAVRGPRGAGEPNRSPQDGSRSDGDRVSA